MSRLGQGPFMRLTSTRLIVVSWLGEVGKLGLP